MRDEEHNRSALVPGTVRNIGAPLRFENVEQLIGFSAEAAVGGQDVKLWTKLAISSDDPFFHKLVENFAGAIYHMARQANIVIDLGRADTVLLVLKPDATAELWLDTAAVSLRCMVKRNVSAGTPIFEEDIADVTAMSFPCISFGASDKVLCVFRVDWRFGFVFDMNPNSNLDIEEFFSSLGTLYRQLRYRHIYEAIGTPAIFDQLLSEGWFPFAEVIGIEFKWLLNHCGAGFDLAEVEAKIIEQFGSERIEHIFLRWLSEPHFAAKESLIRPAIDAFKKGEPVAVIKILITEIEGILNEAYRHIHNHGAKIKTLLDFAEAAGETKAGGSGTLFFPKNFGRYLKEYTFASFDPASRTLSAGSRHAVGHGAAPADSYTMSRALKILLTLDQLAFYT